MAKLRNRALNVLQFLRSMQEMRARPVRDVSNYPEVLWLADVKDDDARTACAWNSSLEDAEGLWLSLDRVDRTHPPELPDILEPWVPEYDVQDSQLDRPRLLDAAEIDIDVDIVGAENPAREALESHPEVIAAYDRWLPHWQEWAAEDRLAAPLREPYQALYAIYQAQRAEPERLEVVLGVGLLSTESDGRDIRRHLVAVPATIELDLDTGRLDVKLNPEDADFRLEEDMIAARERASGPAAERIRSELGQLGTVFGPEGVESALREWTNAYSSDAVYTDDLDPAVARKTTVAFAPALILRPRGRQSFIQAIQTVEESIDGGAEVPLAMRQLLEDADVLDDDVVAVEQSDDPETYFFKPANPQQAEVAERLRRHRVVVVQGPPGTGKTHTITNLLTDLLAHGKRVLITSHSSQALKVIKGMLPDEVRDLCVSLTDTSVKSQQDLKGSVETIIGHTTSRSVSELDSEHRTLVRQLVKAREAKQAALDGLRKVREQETLPTTVQKGDYAGTPQAIAIRLAAEEERFGWIGDVNFAVARISREDLCRLVDLTGTVTDEIRRDTRPIPDRHGLMDPETFRQALAERDQLRERLEKAANVDSTLTAALQALDPRTADELRRALIALDRDIQALVTSGHTWVRQTISDIWHGRDARARQHHAESQAASDAVQRELDAVGTALVSGLDQLDPAVSAGRLHELASYLAAGGAMQKRIGTPKPVKVCQVELSVLRIDGRPVGTREDAVRALSACSMELQLRRAEQLWNMRLSGSLGMRATQLADMTDTLGRVLVLKPEAEASRALIQRLPPQAGIVWDDPEALHQLAMALEHDVVARSLAEYESRFDADVTTLTRAASRADAHPVATPLLSAVAERDATAHTAAWAELMRIEKSRFDAAELEELEAKVKASCPAVLADLREDGIDWDARARDIDAAYLWAEWDNWLQDVVDPAEELSLRDDLERARTTESHTLKRMAANRAWRHCRSRMTSVEREGLVEYATSMKKVGKGTGKLAQRFRKQARKALEKSQSAVPAWIMSLQSVVDSVPFTKPSTFDVVIVDEASQSGHEALLLTWLADQVLVVGDDEQISPDNVGIDAEGVFHLQDQLLSDVPRHSLYGPTNSFLEHAEGMAREPVMLREHFRCMPEIIEFSNRLSYRGRLMPVRQHGLERLEPLRRTHIRDAVTTGGTGRQLNAAEAEQVVETIEKCCADPAYDGKSMGVITMLGTAQHKRITALLLDRLGTEEMEERRLLVAGPAAFQGDERDVIFMSMVASPHGDHGRRRIGAWARRDYQQRLNVAASRARDQVWVFHSFVPEDLPSNDFRRDYLDYLSNAGASVPDAADGPVEVFGSTLEQHLYEALAARGYHVRAAVQAGGHHIDLVVVGQSQQLAVECDSDELDASDTGNQDLRQGDLERLGWEFWRVRGSQFFRDPDVWIERLITRLEELDINPQADTVETTVVEIVEAPIAEPEVEPDPTPQPSEPIAAAVTEPVVERPSPKPRHTDGFAVGARSLERLKQELDLVNEHLGHALSLAHAKALSRRTEELEQRRAYLRDLLPKLHAEPVDELPDTVWPGAIVRLRNADDGELLDGVIGSLDLDDDSFEHITAESPLGQQVARAKVGQTISYVHANGKLTVWEVLVVTD